MTDHDAEGQSQPPNAEGPTEEAEKVNDLLRGNLAVSYTHLDVYKRQRLVHPTFWSGLHLLTNERKNVRRLSLIHI